MILARNHHSRPTLHTRILFVRGEKRETHEEEKREAADAARFDAEILALQRMARIEAEEAAQSSEFALSAAASDYGDGHGDLFDDGDDFHASPFYSRDDERAPDGGDDDYARHVARRGRGAS